MTGGGAADPATDGGNPRTEREAAESTTVTIENVGGIRDHELTLERGVTLLTGRNATNRTSLLRALGAGLGGSTGQLRAGAEAGSVALSFDGDRYTRTFERDGSPVHVGGDPYTTDGDIVDRYSCLLADNPARVAVERGGGDALREFIMAPVDTDEVRATIERTRQSIRSLREDLETAERRRDRVSDLERDLEDRRDQLEEVRGELESVREAVAESEADADAAEAADAVVADLQDAREEYERVRSRLETQRNALDSLEAEREEVRAELEEFAPPGEDREALREELERLQRRERDLENAVNSLLSIVEFNEELLTEEGLPGVAAGDEVVPELDPETRTVECWTCGTRVERGTVDDRFEELRAIIDEKRRERNELRTEIDDLRSELREIRSTARERGSLEAEVEDIDDELEERRTRIADLQERKADLEERIEELEAAAADSDDLRDSDLLDRYQRLSELEYKRGQLEEAVETFEAELESAREAAGRAERLETELEERRVELADARSRVADLERAAVETFNDHVETVLEQLDYDNVARVWIERKTDDGDADLPQSSFDLHVVRETGAGTVYEDTVDHLSESERAVVGLVVALAGYLVHDVHETVPVMLLDSLEAIDADRIAALVEYFTDFVPFLVVALLPEDAAALPEEYDRVRMGGTAD
jgi:DNA repair ATPase RecN